MAVVLPAGCVPAVQRPTAGPATPTFERAVVVDAPVVGREVSPPPRTPQSAPLAATPQSPAPLVGPAPTGSVILPESGPGPKPEPPLQANPQIVGQVIILAPIRCGAITLSPEAAPDCDSPSIASGADDGRQFVAAVTFDLRSLPPSSEVLYAALELTGLNEDRRADYGRWYVRLIDPDAERTLDEISFGELTSAPLVSSDAVWRLRANELAPGVRNTLVFGEPARAELAARLGRAMVSFRIDGPTARTNLFVWEATGSSAPRLRVAYVAEGAADASTPLILWDDGGE